MNAVEGLRGKALKWGNERHAPDEIGTGEIGTGERVQRDIFNTIAGAGKKSKSIIKLI